MTIRMEEIKGREQRTGLDHRLALLGGLALTGLMVSFAWVGWIGSDDARHIAGALGWYEQFPYVPQHHGEFRHFITLPAAFSFLLFGISEYAAVLPILIYFFGFIAITLRGVAHRVNGATALLSVALISSMSITSLRATVVYSDIAEAFFVISSFWCFLRGIEIIEGRIPLLLLAGVLAGAGWLTRETTAALLLYYGFLFLAGFGLSRRLYWVMAIGFFIPLAGDALYFWIVADSPFYRYTEILEARLSFHSMRPQAGELFNDIGNIQMHPLLDPLLALLVNHEFGLIFYLTPFVAWGLWRDRSVSPAARRLGLLFVILALTWFVVTSFAVTRYHPRYFTVSGYAIAIATAIWFTQSLFPQRPRLCICLATLVLAVGVAGIYVENRNPVFGARILSHLAAESDAVIHSDPETYRRSSFLLKAEGAETRASSEPPVAGSLFLFNPKRAANRPQLCNFKPAADWEPLKSFQEEQKVVARLFAKVGLTGLLHPSIERRLLRPNAQVTLYRVGGQTACHK